MLPLLTFPQFSPVLLPGESREELEALLETYLHEYDPQSIAEERALCHMVDAEWRLRRLRLPRTNDRITDIEARREELHLVRLHDRALQNLLKLRRERRTELVSAARSLRPVANRLEKSA